MSYDIYLFDIIMFCVAFIFKEHIHYYYLIIFSSCCICYILHVTSMCSSNKQWYLVITVFCTSPLPCSGGHGPPSGPWPWAVINAASQYGTLRNNSYAGGST